MSDELDDTLSTFVFVLHVFLTEIRLQSNQNLWTVAWPKRNQFIAPLVIGALEALAINKTEAYEEAVCIRVR